jgi:hypothetical protein
MKEAGKRKSGANAGLLDEVNGPRLLPINGLFSLVGKIVESVDWRIAL